MKTLRYFTLVLSLVAWSTSLEAQNSKPVVDGIWKIKSLNDSGKMIDLGGKESHVTINTKGKSILLHIGCNHISSAFEFVTADRIKPLVLTATRKTCSEHNQALESNLRYALEQTNSVRKEDSALEFYKDGTLLISMVLHSDHGKKKK